MAAEAANCLLAMTWKNTGNKVRTASKGAVVILLKRVIRYATSEEEDCVRCFERAAFALSSILLFKSNHELLVGITIAKT